MGAETVIQAIEAFRMKANRQVVRLREPLLELVRTWDCALSGKSGEDGRRMRAMQHEQAMDHLNARFMSEDAAMDATMNYQEQQARDPYTGKRRK